MTTATASLPAVKPTGIKDKVLPGHWYRLADLTALQQSQAASVFAGLGLENHLYLIHDAHSSVLDREHLSAFDIADLISIDAI